ncbi:hypothetical protein ACFY0P_32010 [Streptomyces sp. NPDC001714]|uniref:hypothetical protein n=1 Tax=Streptomyces sp. NPDC001714 TaxID=3364603 RepID=UPI0036AC71B6
MTVPNAVQPSGPVAMTADDVPVEHVTFAHGALDLIGRLLSVESRPGDAGWRRGRFRLSAGAGVRITIAGLEPAGAARLGLHRRPGRVRGHLRGG